ncbi:MAG: DsrE family protein [Halobacteriota archaeon]|nr:DsrE family protein [Halobacteriota archaeon]
MADSLLVIITKPPYGTEDAFAGLRLALSQIAGGMVDRSDAILIEDGAFNAIGDQRSDVIEMPSNVEAIEDLLDMGCTVYCVSEGLKVRGIANDKLMEGLSIISKVEVSDLVSEYDLIASF